MNKEELFKQWESELYDKYSNDEMMADEDFRSMAIGFFIAKGLALEESIEMYQYCINQGKW
jgi:hypothetical protein